MSSIRLVDVRRVLFALTVVASLLLAGVPQGSAAEEEIRIVRDKFGVPHVFASTAEGAAYGAGYALAQDRLWQMTVFKHIAKGRLSDILGPIVVDIDKEVRFFTYTAEERAARFETLPDDIKTNLQAFADGVNAWLAEVRTNPSVVPFEFTQLGEEDELAEEWTVDDSIALGDVLILAFGSGGGNELEYAGLLAELTEEFGKVEGKRAFDDLIMRVDPDSPVSIPRDFNYERSSTFARVSDANERRGLTEDARLGLEASQARAAGGRQTPAATGTLAQLALIPDIGKALEDYSALEHGRRLLRRVFKFGSNAQIAGPSMSEEGNTIQTGGPQVGYLLPQWLADFGIHGGNIDATGMTFAGAGPAVLIGRGPGYAWTTTTGASDLTDTYVEELNPDDPNQYRYKGRFEDMDCRTETYTFRGVPFEKQEICRTRHGPVVSVDEDNDVAYSVRYAWFNREGQTIEGFFRYNEVKSVEDFATFANFLSSNHNMFYTDDQGNFGYWHPGNHVVRTRGVDIRLPQDGTGGSEWHGLLPIQKVPHAVNFSRGWLANWNNQPAAGWARERGHPALDNVLDLEDALDPGGEVLPDPFGGEINPDGLLGFDDANANLRYAAFKDHRDTYFSDFLPMPEDLESDLHKKAAEEARSWNGFLNDSDGDGMVDSAGKTIIDRWVQHMEMLAFHDDLGGLACWEVNACFTDESVLWHLLNTGDRAELGYDWLGELSPEELAAQAFASAVDELSEEHENQDPSTWRQEIALEHYQRLNADLVGDLAEGETSGNSADSGRPGDVADHIQMDRGTYNHIVAYLNPPGGTGLGNSESMAGSVIPPGQSGFINQLGQEDSNYESQLDLYTEWRYKPMPTTLEEALAVATSDETITRAGS